jgi:N-methylhydantoinase B
VLEMNFPLRVRRYQLREASGGAGEQRGGDGVVREYEFLEATTVTLLTERRSHSPWGLAGGGAGAAGENWRGTTPLPAKASFHVAAGERISIATPGGGGWGSERS